MEKRFFREVDPSKRLDAAKTVQSWGYGREIPEAEESHWVSWGDDSFAWFQPVVDDEIFSLHACTSPDAPKRDAVNIERTKIAIEVIAELLGAKVLVCAFDEDTPAYRAMRKLLVSRGGWVENPHGCVKQLGA